MKRLRWISVMMSISLFIVLLNSACQETASNLTDRALSNLEQEVGGAAEQASQNAGDKAGGEICGAPLAVLVLPATVFIKKAQLRRNLGRKNSATLHNAVADRNKTNSDKEDLE